MSNTQEYVQWFRGAAPYIKAHRKKTFVILVSDDVIFSDRFIGLVHDIALLNHLGIKLVLLHGSRKSIDSHLEKNNTRTDFHQNIRISDAESMPLIIQAINQVRTYFESQLSMGLPNTPMSGSEISLVSGNFVTGMPLGVIDGVDMQHSGKVRDIKRDEIADLLTMNHVLLLSNLGYSRTGEVFNLPAEELAAEVACALKADKLIYIQEDLGEGSANPSSLSTRDCEHLIASAELSNDRENLLRHAVRAIQMQVKRVHLIDQNIEGGLLLELFTRNGCGTLITNLFYEGIRKASIDDIGGILSLIEPLQSSGVLVERSREQLELEINHFQVIEKDGMIIACIASIPTPDSKLREVACLAVHADYQNTGLGNQLLELVEMESRQSGVKQLFALTTRTSHWFIEHEFLDSPDFSLPEQRKANLNPQRGSKVLVKTF